MSEVKNLICEQGDFTLQIPHLEIPDEGMSLLSGPSGSGKSSLALSLCGLKNLKPGFQWIFQNQDLALFPPSKREISFLFQTLELFPHMSGEKNILFPAHAKHLPSEWINERFSLLKDHLMLSPFLKKPIHLLSGGEKQRVALARAFMAKPRIFILDEPFSHLDEELKKISLGLIEKILRSQKCPALIISHDIKIVKSLASKNFFIRNGQLDPGSSSRIMN